MEKNSFIPWPGKGGHSWLMPSKLCVPIWSGVGGGGVLQSRGGVVDKDLSLCRCVCVCVCAGHSFNPEITFHQVVMGEL